MPKRNRATGRFVKRSSRARKRSVPMAKRSRSRRYVARARSGFRRARGIAGGLMGGKVGKIVQGGAAGLLAGALNGRVPYSTPISYGAVGYLTGNETLLTLCGMQAAALIPNPLATGGGGGAGFI